jgi:transcriptional regulator with XRE-family HTH domain
MLVLKQKVKELLDQREMTVKEFCSQVGISNPALYKMYKRNSIDTKYLERMATVLKVPISTFFDSELTTPDGRLNQSASSDLNEKLFNRAVYNMAKHMKLYRMLLFVLDKNYPILRIKEKSMTDEEKNADEKISTMMDVLHIADPWMGQIGKPQPPDQNEMDSYIEEYFRGKDLSTIL